MNAYTPRYRPPTSFTLPRGQWTLRERPAVGFPLRTDLPISQHPHGVVVFDRALTAQELDDFELDIVDNPVSPATIVDRGITL